MRYSALALAIIGLNAQYACANETTAHVANAPLFILPEINVDINELSEVGQTKYNQEQLSQTANGNKTISDFLRVNPSVQFSQDAMAGGEQGELKAVDISINGALPYDNKLLLDNVSLNNLINPAGGNNEFAITGMGGSSFASTVNTDLICELNVLDSNVSAEYGEFTGGVIQAKTCAPKTKVGDLHGSVSYDYTNSAWSRMNYVDEEEFELFENNQDYDYQKEFVKQGLAASLYGRFSDDLAFSFGASKRWSEIDYTTQLVNTTQSANQQRENQNVYLNVYANLNPLHQLKVGLQYQNDHADLNLVNNKDSNRKIDEENTALELELTSAFNHAKIVQSLVYQQQVKDSKGQRNENIGWGSSDAKNWSATNTASEGSFGHQQQELATLNYKIKADFDAFKFANTQHHISIGAGYGHYKADWSRLNDAFSYFKPAGVGIAGIASCINASGERDAYCDETYNDGVGQYHIRRHFYNAGNINVGQDRGYLFVEDKINWQNTFKVNLGVRAEYDSLSKQTNIAPRTALHYLPFADERLQFTTGWNRYYANNMFSYHLEDGINLLGLNQTRASINDAWVTNGYALSSNVERSQLDVPKTDETVFAISSRLGLLDAQIKYVHRDNQDQIRKHMLGQNPIVYEFDNIGKSKADVYTFTLSNHTPIALGTSLNTFVLALDHTEVVRNFNHYESTLIPSTYDPYVLYEGEIIHESNRPANNFSRPWTARLSLDTRFENLPIKISQLLRYRSAYDSMVLTSITDKDSRPTHNGYVVDSEYKGTRIGSAFNWDIRSTYDYQIAQDQIVTFGLTVNNVLNKHNKYTESGSSNLKSEVGRQFIADVSFKF